MPFDWGAIREQDNADLAFYRLLGEMLQQPATPADLERIRGFLGAIRPGPDAWHSLGEALFHTTHGSVSGYRLWCGWARSLEDAEFTEAEHLAAWQRFSADISDGLEEFTEPETIQFESDAEDLDVDDTDESSTDSVTRVVAAVDEVERPLVEQPVNELVPLLPSGPYTLRVFDEVWEEIDELTLIRLVRRGVFLGIELLYGARWVPIGRHPGFQLVVERLRGETRHVLGEAEKLESEVTRPGTA